jgi:hypothetical protein
MPVYVLHTVMSRNTATSVPTAVPSMPVDIHTVSMYIVHTPAGKPFRTRPNELSTISVRRLQHTLALQNSVSLGPGKDDSISVNPFKKENLLETLYETDLICIP